MGNKLQTLDQIKVLAATEAEAAQADALGRILRPGLRVGKTGRVDTIYGDKTLLGLYRTLARFVDFSQASRP
jgi:hypothetical protein